MFVHPVSHSLLSSLLSDEVIEEYFSDTSAVNNLIKIEKSLTTALIQAKLIPFNAGNAIRYALSNYQPDINKLRSGIARDGTPLPAFLREIRYMIPNQHHHALHYGATSQDIIDTALALTLKAVNVEFDARIRSLTVPLNKMIKHSKNHQIMGRTRMQNARYIMFSDRLSGWLREIKQQFKQFNVIRNAVEILQLGGPVGDGSTFNNNTELMLETMAKELRLKKPVGVWHCYRTNLANYASWLTALTGILAKIGLDCALMAQMGEMTFIDAGGSSSMPYKSNPIAAETLVALGRFNATLVSGMQHAVIHEQERSGAAWTLEWMILPQLCVATGASLRSTERLMNTMILSKKQ